MSISSRASLLSTAQSGQIPEALAQRLTRPSERPGLRPDLIVRHLVQMGESKWVVKNPETRLLYTFSDVDWAFISLFDGSLTHSEIRDAYNAEHPGDLIEQSFVLDYEESLQQMGLLARSGSERSLALMQRLRDSRRLKAEEKEKRFNIFFMLFPVADPNEFLNKTVKYVRWIWSPEIVALGLVLFALTTAVFVQDFSAIWKETVEVYSFIGKPISVVLQFYLIVTLIAAFHELGHAYSMKIYGGDVHSIGFALFFFLPAYFTDTIDSELFESKWHRVCVNIAGIYIESYICVLMTAIWVVTYPDTFIHDFAYKGMIYTGISTVIFNINPLTPTDGYHVLEDLLEVPELRPQSFHYIGTLIQKYLFRLPVEVPELSKRKRRVFLTYGTISIVYTGSLMLAIGALFGHMYSFFAGELTPLLTLLTFLRLFRKRLKKFTDLLRMFYLDKKEYLMSRKMLQRLAASVAIVLLVILIPWPHETLDVSMTLKPARTVQITAPADATVVAVDIREGDRVTSGRLLGRLASRAVESRVRELTARKRGYEGEASFGREAASAADSAASESRAQAAAAALTVSESVNNALLVRAPEAGTILTRRPQDLVGSYVSAGAALFVLGDTRTMRVEMPVTERLIQSMGVGEPVSIRVRALPFRSYRTTISAIAPAAEAIPSTSQVPEGPIHPGERPERFVAVAFLDNGDGALMAGMTADAKLLGKRVPYAVQWWKIFYHWIRRIIW